MDEEIGSRPEEHVQQSRQNGEFLQRRKRSSRLRNFIVFRGRIETLIDQADSPPSHPITWFHVYLLIIHIYTIYITDI